MKIILPDGSERFLREADLAAGGILTDILARRDLPLNTRCGGRALCRGCEVEIFTGSRWEVVKACQQRAPLSGEMIRIPAASLADRSLLGVSAFDLKLPSRAQCISAGGYGLALDLGTTTLAGALWDLSQGVCLALSTRANPQRRHGDDVLSRISFSLEKQGALNLLQRILVEEGIIPLWHDLLQEAGLPETECEVVFAAGNPTMVQTLTGESLRGLSAYPFSISCGEGVEGPAHAYGLPFAKTLKALPAFGPFVGGDIIAGAIATGMVEDEGTTLLIDFGTNGEILLRHNDQFWATATAAGPAFEGGRLRCGSTARAGTVSSLSLNQDQWQLHAAGNLPSGALRGLTGAAYIDFLAHALRVGLISSLGRFQKTHPLWKQSGTLDDGEAVLVIRPGVVVGEADIAELLQAKAAIGAGIKVLFELAGVNAGDVARVIIAGGFGYHLNPDHAIALGLIPAVPGKRIETVGNTSLAGASLALQFDLSAIIQQIKSRTTIIELNQIASFSDHYTDAMEMDLLL